MYFTDDIEVNFLKSVSKEDLIKFYKVSYYFLYAFLAHLSRRLIGELIVYQSSRRPCVGASTFSNMNISETSRQIAVKFDLKHHWGGGKVSVGFDPDLIRTLVSMATDSSHRVIMGKTASSHFLKCF